MAPRIQVRVTVLKKLFPRPSVKIENQPLGNLTYIATRQLPLNCFNARRNFITSPRLFKKGSKSAKASNVIEEEATGADNPFDFASLEVGIKDVHSRLEESLKKLRMGGRFNPEILESVRVHLSKDDKATIRLGELAQVLPKGGRTIMLLVGEADHVKPIISAIQGSPELNLQPQQDIHTALQLNIPIPPPTKESRDHALAAAQKVGETAYVGVRNSRAAMQKRLRAMELSKAARPDDVRKAHKEMEKLVENGNADVKKMVEAARKAMEQS